ncbi:MAG: DUF4091 domain-containing protein [Clostridia bacterium]|nr:DUF4091 domain-containing protein [Clostridia bacterium]
MEEQRVEVRLISALEKVLPNKEPTMYEMNGSALQGERYHFQIAFKALSYNFTRNTIQVKGELAPYTQVRYVQLAPSTYVDNDLDDYYLTKDCTLVPDPLMPLNTMGVMIYYGQWRTAWVSVCVPVGMKAGVYPLTLELYDMAGKLMSTLTYHLEVIGAKLPETDLVLTNWMHYDGICAKHGVKVFGEKFYRIFDKYLDAFTKSGFNMLLTPLFTPPLDTNIGDERMTAQLVEIEKDGGRYAFKFDKLKKFIRFAMRRGVRYLELSHLFTQWGGKACPKIMAKVDGREQRIFGWDVPSDDPSYVAFLDQFLPALKEALKGMGVWELCYFHLTDEPHADHIPAYIKCRELVKKHIEGRPIMDAMSHYDFYEQGLVDIPVPTITVYPDFAKHNVNPLFVYNCCGPRNGYFSNRFINMPVERTRILGLQLYQTGVQGYLHWGFNFYNSFLSLEEIDPYATTDAFGAYTAGDGYIVYPGQDSVNGSIRSETINDGFQDYRAMKLLESLVGREQALAFLQEKGVEGYQTYPRDAKKIKELREEINLRIKNCL